MASIPVPGWFAKHMPAGLVSPGPYNNDGDYGPYSTARRNVVVIHTAETPERYNAAENVSAWAARERIFGSFDLMVDADSALWDCPENRISWASPGLHGRSWDIEQAGYASQTAAQWDDAYSRAMIERTAHITAILCVYNPGGPIPIRRLSVAQLRAGMDGICGHDTATYAFPETGGTHTDPGPNFPWDHFISRVNFYAENLGNEDDMPLNNEDAALVARYVWGHQLGDPTSKTPSGTAAYGSAGAAAYTAARYAASATRDVARLRGELAGVTAALSLMAAADGAVDMAAVTAAAERGAERGVADAIAAIDVTVQLDGE